MGTSVERFKDFQATNWINNETPLNATNMNKIEENIASIVQILKEYEDNALGSQTLNTTIVDIEDGGVSKNSAQGAYSTAAGLGTVATNEAEFVVGKYNAPFDESEIETFGHPLFTIGYGTVGEQKNLLVATDMGHIIASGNLHTDDISATNISVDDISFTNVLTISSGDGTPVIQLTKDGVTADKAEIDNLKSNIIEATEKIYGPSYEDFDNLDDKNKDKLLVNYETFNALKSVVDKFFDAANIDDVENFVDTLKEIQEEFGTLKNTIDEVDSKISALDESLADVAKSGNYEDLENTPDTLPNPEKLIVNGTEYDGSSEVNLTLSQATRVTPASGMKFNTIHFAIGNYQEWQNDVPVMTLKDNNDDSWKVMYHSTNPINGTKYIYFTNRINATTPINEEVITALITGFNEDKILSTTSTLNTSSVTGATGTKWNDSLNTLTPAKSGVRYWLVESVEPVVEGLVTIDCLNLSTQTGDTTPLETAPLQVSIENEDGSEEIKEYYVLTSPNPSVAISGSIEVDQSYNPDSENAASGIAVKGAIDAFRGDAGVVNASELHANNIFVDVIDGDRVEVTNSVTCSDIILNTENTSYNKGFVFSITCEDETGSTYTKQIKVLGADMNA